MSTAKSDMLTVKFNGGECLAGHCSAMTVVLELTLGRASPAPLQEEGCVVLSWVQIREGFEPW
jgi:hypothetical protein